MKKLFLFCCSAILINAAHAQKTEFSGNLNSGFFTFRGISTEKVSGFNTYSNKPAEGYTNNPYSSNLGAAYGLSAQVQRVTRKHLIVGANLGFEVLKSNMEINSIYDARGNALAATGHSSITYHFVNLYPFAGYRFTLDCLQFDLLGGFDIAKPIKAHEKGTATDYAGNKFTSSLDRPLDALDVRGRLQVNAFYKKAGLSLSFAEGITNYKEGWIGGTNLVFSRLYRIGLIYKIN